jgi:hypothetical protein
LFLHVNPNGTCTSSQSPVYAQAQSSLHAQLRVLHNLDHRRSPSRARHRHSALHPVPALSHRHHSRSIPVRPIQHLVPRLRRGPTSAWTTERVFRQGSHLIIDLESVSYDSQARIIEVNRLRLSVAHYPDDIVISLQTVPSPPTPSSSTCHRV